MRNRARPSGVVRGAGPAAPPRAGVASERLGITRRPAAWPVVRGRGYTPEWRAKATFETPARTGPSPGDGVRVPHARPRGLRAGRPGLGREKQPWPPD